MHKNTHTSPEQAFGELRSMFHRGPLTHTQRDRLLELLVNVQLHHPNIYDEQWIPYLRSNVHLYRSDGLVSTNVEQLEIYASILPFAKFILHLEPMCIQSTAQRRQLIEELHTSHALNSVYSLKVSSQDVLESILSSTHLSSLQYLETNLCEDPFTIIQSLIASSLHHSLESLSITHSTSTHTHTPTLDAIDLFPSLRRLHISNTLLFSTHLSALGHASFLSHIEDLKLAYTDIYISQIEDLFDTMSKPTLRRLDISGSPQTAHPEAELIKCIEHPALSRLQHLAMRDMFTTDTATAFFEKLRTASAPRLRSLDLSRNHIGFKALRYLATSRASKTLRKLDLRHVNLEPKALDLVNRHPFFSKLDELLITPKQFDTSASLKEQTGRISPHRFDVSKWIRNNT